MTGIEPLIKVWPVAAAICLGLIAYGEIRADIKNLQNIQTVQYQTIQAELNTIQQELTQINSNGK